MSNGFYRREIGKLAGELGWNEKGRERERVGHLRGRKIAGGKGREENGGNKMAGTKMARTIDRETNFGWGKNCRLIVFGKDDKFMAVRTTGLSSLATTTGP